MQLFGVDTGEAMPEHYRHDHAAWDAYVGQVWFSVLKQQNCAPNDVLIELAPGASAKLGYALQELGFHGTLHVVDALPEALDALRVRYEALLPDAEIHYVASEIGEAIPSLPAGATILASHVLDDMLIGAAESEKALAWGAAYTHSPSEALQATWQELEKDGHALATCKSRVVACWKHMEEQLKPRCIILSQYPSSTLYDHGMGSLNEAAEDILNELRAALAAPLIAKADIQSALSQRPHYGNLHIGQHVLNAAYWAIWQQKKN